MTGQDFQDKLDALVVDLQTKGKGQTVNIMFRDNTNSPSIFPLSSTAQGVVNAGQLAAIQAVINDLKPMADDYTVNYAPVQTALDNFKTAQAPHEALITAASTARATLQTALDGDNAYQTAKTALDAARADADYISASAAYKSENVSENYSELSNAKGKYTSE